MKVEQLHQLLLRLKSIFVPQLNLNPFGIDVC
jgi:hypothetical protein